MLTTFTKQFKGALTRTNNSKIVKLSLNQRHYSLNTTLPPEIQDALNDHSV